MPFLPTEQKYHLKFDELVLSKPEAAAFFGYKLSNFRRICKDQEFDKGQKKGYVNVHQVFTWWKEQHANIGELQSEMTVTEVRKAFEYEKLLRIRVENQELAGNLIPKDKIRVAWKKRYIDLKMGLMYLISRLNNSLFEAKREDFKLIIEKEVNALLRAFNRNGRFTPKQE